MPKENERLYYSISEVCELTDLKPHVLRYWETAFPMLRPSKNQSGNRVYRPRDLELIRLIRRLLYEERFTVDGARQKIEDMRRTSGPEQMELEIPPEASGALPGLIEEVCAELREIIDSLGRDPMAVDGGGV
ncbi:MAG TPA: MerR family transcriptional regulator [Candidatus Fermentibacter daniensis]|nr:MerR family transcriptional regulator [Candidatus Fermentibacter daniensis]HOR06853.1 MerR family transcriptional regulator [Candidatus Fermentibacter daniensis]HPK51082.1 MerR family transcriptional regulator [Candidatus Fermentibacter daniensis]HQE56488.1 MerR family transcriptional regulator [Candidatus Fermentibacter daniensis]HQH92108.1 MerR family transcriptional regulator [Candidatus Fermentibacter daniensis]